MTPAYLEMFGLSRPGRDVVLGKGEVCDRRCSFMICDGAGG